MKAESPYAICKKWAILQLSMPILNLLKPLTSLTWSVKPSIIICFKYLLHSKKINILISYFWLVFRVKSVCLSIHTYIHTSIHLSIHSYIHTYIHLSIHSYIHTSIYTFIHTYMHTYIYLYIHTYIHTSIYTFIHTYIHTSIYTFIHTYLHISIYTFIHTCIHTYIHPYIHTYIHPYIYLSIHSYMHTYIHLSIHSYIHTSIYTFIHSYIHTSIYTYIQVCCTHAWIKASSGNWSQTCAYFFSDGVTSQKRCRQPPCRPLMLWSALGHGEQQQLKWDTWWLKG